jgi:hypothetical protein
MAELVSDNLPQKDKENFLQTDDSYYFPVRSTKLPPPIFK